MKEKTLEQIIREELGKFTEAIRFGSREEAESYGGDQTVVHEPGDDEGGSADPFAGLSVDRSPAEEAVEDKIYDLVDAIKQMGKSNPDMTDTYIYLFKALQQAGVNVSSVAVLAEGRRK